MLRSILAAAIAAALVSPAAAQKPERPDKPPKSDNDVLPGEVWIFDATKGELNRRGEFRIFDKKIFNGEKNLGTISVKGDEATLIVRGGGAFNGRMLIKRDAKSPGAWAGVIHHGDG